MDAASLLQMPARNVREVATPKRGGSVWVRELLGYEALRLRDSIVAVTDTASVDGQARVLAVQLAAFLCDESGATLCDVDQALTVVAAWYPPDILAVIKAGLDLNRTDEAGVEAAEKN